MTEAKANPWLQPEFWKGLLAQLIGLLALLGVIARPDVDGLQDAAFKALAAVGVVVANAVIVVNYFRHRRLQVPDRSEAGVPSDRFTAGLPSGTKLLGLLLLFCAVAPGAVRAADDPHAPAVSTFRPARPQVIESRTPVTTPGAPQVIESRTPTTGIQIGLLNCCPRSNQPAPAAPAPTGPDPTTIAMLQQVLANQQQILSQLAQLQASQKGLPPPSAGSPSPINLQPIYLPYQPNPLPPGYSPHPIGGGGYSPNPLPPGYAPNPLPPGFAPNPLPPGYAPNPIGSPGTPGPGYNPNPLPRASAPVYSPPPAQQMQRYTNQPSAPIRRNCP